MIDLTFVNGQAIWAGTVREWAIDPSFAHDADHLGIKFVIAHGQTEIENLMDIKYCLKDVKPDDWTKELETALAQSLNTLQPLYSAETLQPDTLDQCVDAITEAMQAAMAAMAKI